MNIREWLERLGLGQYAAGFEALGIAPDEVARLTEQDLEDEFGVASLPHRGSRSGRGGASLAMGDGSRRPAVVLCAHRTIQ